jgi:Fe-S cluster assembly protein SufD
MSAPAAKIVPNPRDRYRALFHGLQLPDNELTTLRTAALEHFLDAGFPTQRDEGWKYTNLRRLETRHFGLPAAGEPSADESLWITHAGARRVVVDGCATPALSSTMACPPGVTVLTLGQWLEHAPDEAASFLRQHAAEPSAFTSLNQALLSDGVVVEVGEDVECELPLYLVHHWSSSGRMSHPRIIVRAGRNSRCVLIEHYVGATGAESFTNAVTSIAAGHNARVSHYRVQQEATSSFHIGHTQVSLDARAKYELYELALGASLSRVATHVALRGSGADASLCGLLMPGGSQHLDTFTCIEHAAAHTTSSEEYRGIADSRGRAVFRGKVIVRPDAQHIDARQSIRNLLLSPTAEIDSRPELEIYANDVKCSHGATTGQLDTAALFYLRSRGLAEVQARSLLIRAFAESIVTKLKHIAVAQFVERYLEQRFAGLEVRT